MNIPNPRRNVGRAGGLVKKDALVQAVFSVFLVANHVFDLSGQLAGRGYHLMFFAVSILLLYRTTVFRLSVSKHGHLQFLPSHQLRLWPPVGHHPMLGGSFLIQTPFDCLYCLTALRSPAWVVAFISRACACAWSSVSCIRMR